MSVSCLCSAPGEDQIGPVLVTSHLDPDTIHGIDEAEDKQVKWAIFVAQRPML